MGYPPADFWKSNVSELYWLVQGHNGKHKSNEPELPTKQMMEDLKRRFPDGE